ncbi:hypothetical protein [Robertmurraya andreesenii]|uniref:Lipoprotein n=1 Tax=Anoxybacillus andreesenii TaxID=1325932 RepID=A0ABT9V262_9BACL|nr:hypothetical protein [Robertmurraya andreesenii]MDQ0155047.1 hypothetical protein [Robertmurraya andreesenii]
MKKRLFLTALSATLSLGFLGACGTGNNNLNDDDGVNFRPVRYDRPDNNDLLDNNRGNFNDGVNPVRYDRDNDRGLFNNRNNRNNNDLFDDDFNTDIIDNNRGANGIAPGTNGRDGTMRNGTGGQR